MPPRQRPYHEIEMEELGRQLQQLQATDEIQQAQIEEQRRRLEGESDESDSSYADNHHSQKQQFRSSDIKMEISDFEGKKETKPLVSLVANEQFKVTKEEAQAMSFILLHESTEGTILPPEIEQLLAKYPDVILQEIPPQRDKHQRLQTFKVGDLKINDNAYKVELPGSYGVSVTFNVADLSPYFDDEVELDSRAGPIQPGEDGICQCQIIILFTAVDPHFQGFLPC
ncbi:hypothetical protein SESBI_29952 [Sesbania bispinosa]|nr:hypothetical protein SESBI_29952 [Sesbania bispinosa]